MGAKHKTYEEIKNIIKKTGCELITTEKELIIEKDRTLKAITKINLKIKCICGNIFYTTYNRFSLGKQQCEICRRKAQSKKQSSSTQEFKNKMFEKYGNKYTVLGEYINNKTKILIRHNCSLCNNYEWEIKPNAILQKHICPKCYNINRFMKDQEFKQLITNKYGNEFVILEEYKGNRTKIKVMHNSKKCNNYIWHTTPNSLLCGIGCPCCNNLKTSERFKKTNKTFLKELSSVINLSEYKILNEYKGVRSKIKIQHLSNNCNNYIWTTTPAQLLQGQKCPICSKNIKTTEHYKKEVYDLVGDEYTVLGEYININTKILMRHNICSHEWNVIPHNFISKKSRCPICSSKSRKGQTKIRNILKFNKISFLEEHRIKSCKNKKPLPFDFAIFEDKEKTKLKYLIEYDGLQHYKPERFGGISEEKAIKNLQYVQNNDKIKNKYCIDNNIKLIRIPYWEFNNIELILNDILLNNNLNSKYIINNQITSIK